VEENLWLRGLNKYIDETMFTQIDDNVKLLDKSIPISAYLDVVIRANLKIVMGVIKVRDAYSMIAQALEETGQHVMWEARGEQIGILKTAKNMISLGFSFESIVSATQLDPEKVKELYQAR